jgi:hypothetical protein
MTKRRQAGSEADAIARIRDGYAAARVAAQSSSAIRGASRLKIQTASTQTPA